MALGEAALGDGMIERTDTERMDALSAGGRVTIWPATCKFPGEDEWKVGWCIAGFGVQAGSYRTPRAAIDAWIEALDQSIIDDPEHFKLWARYRYAEAIG